MENEKMEEIFLVLEDKLDKVVNVLKDEYGTIRAGRANPHILDRLQVEAYGGMSPLNQLGNISVADARCLVISPWDKSLLKSIEKAILASNIGLNPTESRRPQRAPRSDGRHQEDEERQGDLRRRGIQRRTGRRKEHLKVHGRAR